MRRALAVVVILACCCTKQEAKSVADEALPLAQKIACAIAKAEQSDVAIAGACDIAPAVMPVVGVPLQAARLKLAAPRLEDAGTDAGAKLGAMPCKP